MNFCSLKSLRLWVVGFHGVTQGVLTIHFFGKATTFTKEVRPFITAPCTCAFMKIKITHYACVTDETIMEEHK